MYKTLLHFQDAVHRLTVHVNSVLGSQNCLQPPIAVVRVLVYQQLVQIGEFHRRWRDVRLGHDRRSALRSGTRQALGTPDSERHRRPQPSLVEHPVVGRANLERLPHDVHVQHHLADLPLQNCRIRLSFIPSSSLGPCAYGVLGRRQEHSRLLLDLRDREAVGPGRFSCTEVSPRRMLRTSAQCRFAVHLFASSETSVIWSSPRPAPRGLWNLRRVASYLTAAPTASTTSILVDQILREQDTQCEGRPRPLSRRRHNRTGRSSERGRGSPLARHNEQWIL